MKQNNLLWTILCTITSFIPCIKENNKGILQNSTKSVLRNIITVNQSNVCPAEKRTKRSINILLCLVRFSGGQTLKCRSVL